MKRWLLAVSILLFAFANVADPPPPLARPENLRGKVWLGADGKTVADREQAVGEARRCLALFVEDSTPSVREVTVLHLSTPPWVYLLDPATERLKFGSIEVYPCGGEGSRTQVPVWICSERDLDEVTEGSPRVGNLADFSIRARDCQDNPLQRTTTVNVLHHSVRQKRDFEVTTVLRKRDVDCESVSVVLVDGVDEPKAECGEKIDDTLTALVVSGTLAEGRDEGHVVVTADPPAEDVMVVLLLEAVDSIPTLSWVGGVSLAVLLLATGYLVLRMRSA